MTFTLEIQGWRKVLGIGQAKPMKYQGWILTFVMEGQDEVDVSMCKFTCSVQSTLRNAEHEPSRGVWGHSPQKNFEKSML